MRRIVAVAAVLLLLLACQKRQEPGPVKVVQIDGVPTVQNPAEPLRQSCPWTYEQDLVLSNEMTDPETSFVYVSSVAVDRDGNIYVLDMRQKRVQVFDRSGHYVRSIGKAGEGPGELSQPGILRLDDDGNLLVYDYQLRRVSWFDRSGRFLRSVSLDKLGWPSGVLPWHGGRLITVIEHHKKDDPSARWFRVLIVDSSGVVVDSLGDFLGGRVKRIPIRGGVVTYYTGYEPRLAWDVAPGPILYLGYSGAYRVEAYDSTGRLVRRFEREWVPAPIPEEDRRRALKRFAVSEEVKKQIEVPKTEPAFYDLLCDDLGNIWLQRTGGAPYRFDVFDSQGRYVCVQTLDAKPLVWSGGFLYARRVHSEEGTMELVRFRRVTGGD